MISRIDVAMTRPRPRPASHANMHDDDADEAFVTCGYTPQADEFSPSFGVGHTERDA